jgi:hypothetical protein
MMMGGRRLKRFTLRTAQRGATQLGFLDVVTAIVVLAILVWAASRQFPAYRNVTSSTTEQSQAH